MGVVITRPASPGSDFKGRGFIGDQSLHAAAIIYVADIEPSDSEDGIIPGTIYDWDRSIVALGF